MTWFAYERKDSSGNTIIDEFVKFVDDEKIRLKMLRMKNLIHDTFLIHRSANAHNIVYRR